MQIRWWELSCDAARRLQWMTHYLQHGRNAAFTCRHFGISRQTFYRWWRRYDPHYLASLQGHSHRPHRLRQPTWTAAQAEAVLALRREYPRWGKDKLVGDLVQLDTKELRPARGVVLKHFSARDMVSRWDVVEVHQRATSLAAAHFLDTLVDRMPFPIAALQVDGGSEFAAEFELACQQRGLPLFVLPPRSPKLNGHVERSHRAHHEEFYQVVPENWNVAHLNPQLRRWEYVYNTVRPHQALGYLTPLEFLERWKSQQKKAECH